MVTMSTYLNCTKDSYKEALRGLYNYENDLIERDGESPAWIGHEINRVRYILNNWDALTDGTNEQTGQGDSKERQ